MKWIQLFIVLLSSGYVSTYVYSWSSPSRSRGIRIPSYGHRARLVHGIPDQLSPADSQSPHLVFPGGGIFFYWQAGAIEYLRERGYDLSQVVSNGASAGALTATLTASNVDFYKATELALALSDEAGVWDRRGGLQGIWGPIIATWLDDLLPDDAVESSAGRLSVLVTPIPSFSKTRVYQFHNKTDLIRCNMASVHIPWFLDGQLTSRFRNKPFIDGSFLATTEDYLPPRPQCQTIVLDWMQDPAMEGRAFEFLQAVSKDAVWTILEQGKAYAKKMDHQGLFESFFS